MMSSNSKRSINSQFRFQYKRDEKGVLVEGGSSAVDGKAKSQWRYEPTVDKYGNWIKKTESHRDANGKPLDEQSISVRTITYY